jgi:ribose transport system permease protein
MTLTDIASAGGGGSAAVEDAPAGRLQRIARVQALQIVLLLAITVAVFAILRPNTFLTPFNIRGMVQNTSIYIVLGVGMTFVIITGGIDLSIGSVLVFSGVVADKVMASYGGQGWDTVLVGTVVACASGLAWGLLNGVLVAKAKVPPLIVTLGSLSAALGFAQILTKGLDLRDAPRTLVDKVGFGNIVGQVPTLAVIAGVVAIGGIILLHRTRFGLHTYAIGSNAEAGRRVGLKVDRHLIKIYALAGLLAGFAGILNLGFFQSTTIGGQSNTALNVIAGVAIGGTSLFGGVGSVFGTVIGLFIPIVLQNGFIQINVQPFWQQVVVGAVLVTVVYVDQLRRAAAVGGRKHRLPFLSQRGRGTREETA